MHTMKGLSPRWPSGKVSPESEKRRRVQTSLGEHLGMARESRQKAMEIPVTPHT